MTRSIRRRSTAAAAGCALVLVLGAGFAGAAPAAAQPERYTAEQVRGFLVGFYGQHGPSRYDREHKVTPELRKKAAETKDYDLLLCAQNEPRNISVGKVTTAQSAGVGWSTITTRWGGGPDGHFTAYVGLDASKPMKLYDIACER
ncbi:hypothetical protein AF335_14275 [Streptomyces eurocidicus]|uniref:Lipoprotein n=1 Tax=Streptomyces eurocidicus TaxID=66423 RepID=A0A2N8NVG0_STREU|nr:hypothetical protein [Streptomyces eurocidicus]MBB5122982.1 hypothetical protein [Streptomyces eurocidicus]MBF6056551.1 hypothetical protein [Streptomyces eurocidicus]PNE32729.1 hypothetical protein AF335_14275 [Streptomyces eurocidicus]